MAGDVVVAAPADTPEYARSVLDALRRRNARVEPAARITHMCQGLLAANAELRKEVLRQQKRADLAGKEKHEMSADLELLRQNEANLGVSRAHIESLQEQLELAKSQAERASREAAVAKATSDVSVETSEQLASRLSSLSEELLGARAETAAQLDRANKAEERAQALLLENGRLLEKMTQAMEAHARLMAAEVESHEAARLQAESKGNSADGPTGP
eukprot:scaffold193142_cov27-Tisochrysis_lutea.AAC.2